MGVVLWSARRAVGTVARGGAADLDAGRRARRARRSRGHRLCGRGAGKRRSAFRSGARHAAAVAGGKTMRTAAYNRFCASLPHANHVVQWGGAQVWKVATKVFAVGGWQDEGEDLYVTFKCSHVLRPAEGAAGAKTRTLSRLARHDVDPAHGPGIDERRGAERLSPREPSARRSSPCRRRVRAELGLLEALTAAWSRASPSPLRSRTLRRTFRFAGGIPYPPRYNIAPSQPVCIVRLRPGIEASGERELALGAMGAGAALGEGPSHVRCPAQCSRGDRHSKSRRSARRCAIAGASCRPTAGTTGQARPATRYRGW